MRDPGEGRAEDGMIRTGARRDRIAARYQPVLAAAVEAIGATGLPVSVGVYGSVATGQARAPGSDVDLLAVGLPAPAARAIGDDLSGRFAGLCREVAIAALDRERLDDTTDAAYGDRVFLRHYGVHLAGDDPAAGWPAFPADARAARGFNGDIAICARRWGQALDTEPPQRLGRALARKTLLAVAGLVSIHDRTWTTDRTAAARRWGEVHPEHAPALRTLLAWIDGDGAPGTGDVRRVLDGLLPHVVKTFADTIGLWS